MADESDISKAEKAYAEAAAKLPPADPVEIKKTPVAKKAAPVAAAPVKMAPVKKAPVAAPKKSTPEKTPVVEMSKAEPAPVIVKPARKAIVKKKPAIKKTAVVRATPQVEPAPIKPAPIKIEASKPAAGTGTKPIPFISKKRTETVAPATVALLTTTAIAPATEPTITELKERIMATAKTSPDLTKIVTDIKDKAKAAYEKGSTLVSEVGEFTKGNLEAIVESGKIIAAGTQEIGRDYVEESKSAFETVTADLKKIAAVKSPTEFFQLQGELARRNFDSAIAFGSKSSEKFVKLSNEALAPISNRVSVAVEKISKAA
jgi:phasin family protein